MNLHPKQILLIAGLVLSVACSSSLTTSNDNSDPVPDSTEVGTNVGSPVPPKTILTFKSNIETDATAYCSSITDNPTYSHTQTCNVIPSTYDMGILAIYLTNCESEVCDVNQISAVNSRWELYKGSQNDIDISSEGLSLDSMTLPDASSNFTVGGLQIVTSYIGQTFPDEETNPVEAAKIVSSLRGVPYRICTTPHEKVDTETMLSRCGNSEAQMGDFLIDTNKDGQYGFFRDGEVSTRPSDYSSELASGLLAGYYEDFSATNRELLFSTQDYYDVSGYFAALIPLSSTITITADTNFTITYDITQTTSFIDGAGTSADFVCITSLDPACPVDTDPLSVGMYDPFYDGSILTRPPTTSIVVE